MTIIAVTRAALNAACHPEFPITDIFSNAMPHSFSNAIIRRENRLILIATRECTIDSPLMVIGNLAESLLYKFDVDDRATVFERCVRLALRAFDKRIALSPNWMPYRQDNRSSVFATNKSSLRILAEENYLSSRNVYIYDVLENVFARDLSAQDPEQEDYRVVLQNLPDLFKKISMQEIDPGSAVELENVLTDQISKGFAFDEWLPLLSLEQMSFVKREVVGPLRVRGAAGTGKTLALVMKVLKLAKDGADNPPRILFLTHSWAIANQVDEMVNSIGREIAATSFIDIFPLMELARQRDYTKVGRKPLGLDSEAGKREALSIIEKIIENFAQSDWIAFKGGTTEFFRHKIDAVAGSNERRGLAWDLLIEFGCVLAAEGLLGRPADRERYMRIRRVGYMMHLSNIVEKDVIFNLWGRFLNHLKSEALISNDQIVSDYLNELQTFYWEAKRVKEGYDYIFVDEMHLFNSQERLVFHNLLSDGDIKPRVVMALDPKQSPREVFADISDARDQINTGLYERARLSNPEKVDFLDVFRYTDQIAALTKSVLDAVPALDAGEDWNIPSGGSVVGPGPTPQYYIENDSRSVFTKAMSIAIKLQREARTHKGQVAILCMDYDRFDIYCKAVAGQYPRDVYIIKSRDDVERLRFMGRRIVFSTPEYVAGLQFDSVVLVDVNANLVPDGGFKGNTERRFLSELYLGISRAERRLVMISSKDCDGLSLYLTSQVDNSLLVAGD